MASVFISHSKSDERIKEFFRGIIESNVGLKPVLMEYEDLTHKNVGTEIKSKIIIIK